MYSDGICRVKLNDKCDFVDYHNQPISNFAYDIIHHFYKTNLVEIRKNGKCGLMNTGGKILIKPEYADFIKYASDNMLVWEDDNYSQYVTDINLNIIIPKQKHQRFNGGYSCGYIVSRGGVYFDTKGNKLDLKFNFDNKELKR